MQQVQGSLLLERKEAIMNNEMNMYIMIGMNMYIMIGMNTYINI